MPQIKPFADFKLHKPADSATIEKYTNVLPHALINIWKKYGFGTFAKGFLKTINPDEYQDLLDETYISDKNPIPIFTTALGDISVLRVEYSEEKKWFNIDIVYYRRSKDRLVFPVKNLDDDDFFREELADINTYKNVFYRGDYLNAVRLHKTIPEYDECYGYEPLINLGGKRELIVIFGI